MIPNRWVQTSLTGRGLLFRKKPGVGKRRATVSGPSGTGSATFAAAETMINFDLMKLLCVCPGGTTENGPPVPLAGIGCEETTVPRKGT